MIKQIRWKGLNLWHSQVFIFSSASEAELIKLFPVMLQLQAQQVPYHIIASGQNDVVKSTILRALNGSHVDLELSKESDIKSRLPG